MSVADIMSAMKLFHLIHFAAAGVLFAGCHNSKPAPGSIGVPAISVETISVTLSNEPIPVVAPGLLARTLEAEMAFKTGGVIAGVNVRAGDEVEAGQILGTLKLDEFDAAVTQTESTLNKVKRDLDRAKSLFVAKVTTYEVQQNAESQVEQAEAAVRAARFNRQTAVLKAPTRGHILARYAEPGETAAAGGKILKFASDSEGWLMRVGLAQREVARIQIGDEASIVFAGIRVPIKAKVARIAEETEAATRNTLVELSLITQPPAGLRSGMVGHAQIFPQKCTPRPVLPLSALVEGDGMRAYIFRVETTGSMDNLSVVHRIPVEIETLTESGAVLRTALEEKSVIVTTGAEFLAEGVPVRVSSSMPIAKQ